jgi:hypothetical protein
MLDEDEPVKSPQPKSFLLPKYDDVLSFLYDMEEINKIVLRLGNFNDLPLNVHLKGPVEC